MMTSCFPDVSIKLSSIDMMGTTPTYTGFGAPGQKAIPGPNAPKPALPNTLGGRLQGIGQGMSSMRTMGGIGAGVGFIHGLLRKPDVEYDENGKPHQKSRIRTVLGDTGRSALTGAGLGLGSKMLGAGNMVGNYGKNVDAGTQNAPDFMHSAHEGLGGGQSDRRKMDLATRPAAKTSAYPLQGGPHIVTQNNGVKFKFDVHGTNTNTGEVHGHLIHPDGSRTQTSFIGDHVASIVPHQEQQMHAASKVAALRLVRNDIYLVAATNGEGFIGTYKGASADNHAVFEIHAPGITSIEAAFDMRKLAHISPVLNTKTGSVARSRDELPFTHEGQKLAEAYAYKCAKRKMPDAFAAHQFKRKEEGMAHETAETPAAEKAEHAAGGAESAPASTPDAGAATTLPKLRAKSKK